MEFRTPIGRVRGLGSAKEGTAHWWAQRVTAIALVPLVIWFVVSVISMVGADLAAMKAWVGHPISAVLLVLLIAATFHHGQLGLQVVIEDYVHTEWVKIALLLIVKAAALILALLGIFAVLKIAFGG